MLSKLSKLMWDILLSESSSAGMKEVGLMVMTMVVVVVMVVELSSRNM